MNIVLNSFATVLVWTLCLHVTLTRGFKLTILHTNDVHGRIQEMNKYNGGCSKSDSVEGKCFGGVERMKTKVDELRSEFPQSLLLDGGDQYQGTLFFYVYGGEVISHFMNLLGYDAMGLGNHEFDQGVEGLKPFVDNATFKVLSANINTLKTPEISTIGKSAIFEVGGEKIGVVGYTTSETPIISKPGKVSFVDEIVAIQAEVTKLEQQGINKIIALGHAGFAKDLEIAQRVRGVDIVVGGHTNTFLYTGQAPGHEEPEGKYPTLVDKDDGATCLVVQDFAFGKYLGVLHVEFNDGGQVPRWSGNPVLLNSSVSKDPTMTQLIESYLPRMEAIKTENVGVSLVELDGDRKSCRAEECNMGNLIADAMVRYNHRYADSLEWNHVAIAIINSGGIRSSIPKGNITTENVLSVAPFRNTMDIIALQGHVILQVLEHSADLWVESNKRHGGFLQVSGLKVEYNMKTVSGSRVSKVLVLCADCAIPRFEPLKMSKTYKLIVSSFLVAGGDGYSFIQDSAQQFHTIGDTDSQLLLDYIKENSPISEGLDGRITFKEEFSCLSNGHSVLPSIMLLLVSTLVISL